MVDVYRAVSELEALNEAEESPVTPSPAMVDLPPTPKATPIVPVVILRPCGLDQAPKNSKIVVVMADGRKAPLLATPAGFVPLAANDWAHALPLGAKVNRVGDTEFVGEQLDDPSGKPLLIAATAQEVIQRFNAHFHDA